LLHEGGGRFLSIRFSYKPTLNTTSLLPECDYPPSRGAILPHHYPSSG